MQQVFVLAHLDRAFWLPSLLEAQPTLGTVWAGIAVAFGFGALHALSPGHGKTLVSAYLIGTKGTPGQALLLGVTTTITHTSSVFVLGLIAVYARRWLERLPMADGWVQYLSLVSAIAVICIGIGLTAFSILSRSLSIHSEFLF